MSTRPRYFLLDAGPVIELHRLGLWSDVLQRCEIVVPEVIADLGVSLEEILGDVGLGRQLDRQYRRLTLDGWVAEGRERRMRGQGLA